MPGRKPSRISVDAPKGLGFNAASAKKNGRFLRPLSKGIAADRRPSVQPAGLRHAHLVFLEHRAGRKEGTSHD
ncbi:hypothetical protein G8A07_00375 [Roseateles sp. DAIF2]|uniref:hypothetical protein n=1 Tax=Roseateles sp. DAIF2 TaxID=2714952 RepID=UPI0018A3179C|nr:hypothetical protein [Roseateles sp. DAIF2]QPF71526.1 hypothetical protein G8A07_00375 [Roseateles sp. DAIF2]